MIYSLPCTIAVFETNRKWNPCLALHTLSFVSETPFLLGVLYVPRPHPAFCCLQYRSNGKLDGACERGWGQRVNMFISVQALVYSKVKLSSNKMIKILDLSLSCSGENIWVATTWHNIVSYISSERIKYIANLLKNTTHILNNEIS